MVRSEQIFVKVQRENKLLKNEKLVDISWVARVAYLKKNLNLHVRALGLLVESFQDSGSDFSWSQLESFLKVLS